MYVVVCDGRRDDVARLCVEAEMHFLPCAALQGAVLSHFPLAFAIYLDPRRIGDYVERFVVPWANSY